MKPLSILGVILIVLGLVGLVSGGFSFSRKEKVADIGPVEISTTETERVPITPIASGAALVAGIALVFAGSKKKG